MKVCQIPLSPSSFQLVHCEMLRVTDSLPADLIVPYFQALIDCGLDIDISGTYHQRVAANLFKHGAVRPPLFAETEIDGQPTLHT
jgi:hypothetical protein